MREPTSVHLVSLSCAQVLTHVPQAAPVLLNVLLKHMPHKRLEAVRYPRRCCRSTRPRRLGRGIFAPFAVVRLPLASPDETSCDFPTCSARFRLIFPFRRRTRSTSSASFSSRRARWGCSSRKGCSWVSSTACWRCCRRRRPLRLHTLSKCRLCRRISPVLTTLPVIIFR